MKLKIAFPIAAAFALMAAVLPQPKKVIAELHWEVTTNWAEGVISSTMLYAPPGQPDPNTYTHHESGEVNSNLVATVMWKNESHTMILETVNIGIVSRSYVLQTTRVYGQ